MGFHVALQIVWNLPCYHARLFVGRPAIAFLLIRAFKEARVSKQSFRAF